MDNGTHNKSYSLDKEISYLNFKFFEATKHYGNKNIQGTDLYEYQVDYVYKINKLKYAPSYILHKIITNIHQYISDIPKT